MLNKRIDCNEIKYENGFDLGSNLLLILRMRSGNDHVIRQFQAKTLEFKNGNNL